MTFSINNDSPQQQQQRQSTDICNGPRSMLDSPPDIKSRAVSLISKRSVLGVFRDYMIEPGQMLCFHGPLLDENRDSLRRLTEQGLLSKDKFKGGYTLTKAGFAAMHHSHNDGSD